MLFGLSTAAVVGYLALLVRAGLPVTSKSPLAAIPTTAEHWQLLSHKDFKYLRITTDDSGIGWGLDDQRGTLIAGEAVPQALALVLPILNRWSGSVDEQSESVRLIGDAGGSSRYLVSFADRKVQTLSSMTRVERLAAEMAANEEVERKALEGELRLLSAAWREAEILAAISDSLLIPAPVEEKFVLMRYGREPPTPRAREV